MTVPLIPGNGETLIEGDARPRLESDVLPNYLRPQRWFAGKARAIKSARVVDASPPGTVSGSTRLVIVEVAYDDGPPEPYFVPLHIAARSPAEPDSREEQRTVLARLEGGAFLIDALVDDPTCEALLAIIERGQSIATARGAIKGTTTAAFYDDARGPREVAWKIFHGAVEQSNSVIIYGDRFLMKVFRRLEPGLNPDFEIGRFLAERTPFDRAPKCAGLIEYERPGAEPITLAILQEFVRNQGTGWEHALGLLAKFYAGVADRSGPPASIAVDRASLLDLASAPIAAEVSEAIGEYLPSARTLGRRTAELHLALASDPTVPAFAPEPLSTEDLARITSEARAQAETSLGVLRTKVDGLKEPTAEMARGVMEGVPPVLAKLEGLPNRMPGAFKIRCHGDYHLGQVLWSDNDFVVLDFEGEPSKPLARRREKETPLKDVVGMLRSFDYAAYAGLFAFAQDRPDDFDRLIPWARIWASWTSAVFLREYLTTVGDAKLLPPDRADVARLLQSLTLEKALYELLYELNNRPDWVRIPLQGILALVEQKQGRLT